MQPKTKTNMLLPSNNESKQTESFCGEDVKLISYCPLCGSSYVPAETNVLGEKEGSHLLHMTCGNCSNATLALVIVSSAGVSSVGLSTDLSFGEIDQFKNSSVVSTDDVIELHSLLQDEEKLFSCLG